MRRREKPALGSGGAHADRRTIRGEATTARPLLLHDSVPAPPTPSAPFFSTTFGGRGMAGDPDQARAYRSELVQELAPDIRDPRVTDAMMRVPRHLFVPSAPLYRAYRNYPLPIGYGQTISQPAIVAMMTEALELGGRERVLEIGTGSGYQAAILSLLASEVYTIEVVEPLADEARERLAQLGYANVQVRAGDGYAGWPEKAPFDRIVVTAAPDVVPQALVDQLAEGGVLVAPIGPSEWTQRLLRYRKTPQGISIEELAEVRFVPMVPRD